MQIKYITLNVWNGGRLMDEIIAFLQKEKPDIIALQEVYNSHNSAAQERLRTVDVLQDALDFGYTSFSPAFFDNLPDAMTDQGNAVLSHFPILATQTTLYDIPYKNTLSSHISNASDLPRILQHVVIEANETEINVYNTHGIWGEDGEDNPRRLHMADVITSQIKDKEKVILSGDFNVNHYTKSIHTIEQQVTNVFKDELTSTFNLSIKDPDSGFSNAVVDNIFVSSDIKIDNHYMPRDRVSDHRPLVAIFEIE